MTVSWQLLEAVGGHVSQRGACFTSDGRHYAVLLSLQLRVYFVATRQCVRVVRLAIAKPVAAVADTNPLVVRVVGALGTVLVVNWRDKTVAEETLPEEPVYDCVSWNDAPLLLVGKGSSDPVHLTPHTRTLVISGSDTPLAQVKNVLLSATLPSGSRVAMFTLRQVIHVYDIAAGTSTEIAFPYKHPATVLAVLDQGTVAMGTASGVIQLLYGPGKPQRLLRWHVDRVRALRFLPDGHYLLLGGGEKVLVFWQLDTDKQQFLPRLNGAIEHISAAHDMYALVLDVSDSTTPVYEHLVLSAGDLALRLSVAGMRPQYAAPLALLERTRKKLAKKAAVLADVGRLKHDFTAPFEVHPSTGLVYFPNGSRIQAFDRTTGDQVFVMNAAHTTPTGKVRDETKVVDPQVVQLQFSRCGTWMATVDATPTPEVDHLLSSGEVVYLLKFWHHHPGAKGAQPHWELATRVVEPHGTGLAIADLLPAPQLYHGGVAFATADTHGGVRIWRPRAPRELHDSQQTAWTLRKTKPAGPSAAKGVALAWLEDSLVVLLAEELQVVPLDVHTLAPSAPLPPLAGSRIRGLHVVDDRYLVVVAKQRLACYDLLAGQATELSVRTNMPAGGSSLVAVDHTNNVVCVCANYYAEDYTVQARVYVFDPSRLAPEYVAHHPRAVSGVRWVHGTGFVLLDVGAELVVVHSGYAVTASDAAAADYASEVGALMRQAELAPAAIANGHGPVVEKKIDLHTFELVVQQLEGMGVATLFDRIASALE